MSRRWLLPSLIAAVVGAVLLVIGGFVDLRQTMFSYLTAFLFGLSVAIGALFFVMIAHTAGAKWFVLLRRVTSSIAATLPLYVLLFIPIALLAPVIFPWAAPQSSIPHALAETIDKKRKWLNLPFWIVRAAIYFASWIVLQQLLRSWSLRNDRTPDARYIERQRSASGVGLVIAGLTGSYAAFDWIMSIDPSWYSDVFGVYFLVGGFLGCTALVAIAAFAWDRDGALGRPLRPDHFHAVGRVMLTGLILWAYIAFVQFLLVWIADLPAEVTFYRIRVSGGWKMLSVGLVVGQFVVPFFGLLSRELKRAPRRLAWLAGWILVLHYLDVYWLVMPMLHAANPHVSIFDLGALLAIGGITVAFGAWRGGEGATVPRNDPDLASALGYTSP